MIITEALLNAISARVHDEAGWLKGPDEPHNLQILILEDIPNLIAEVRRLNLQVREEGDQHARWQTLCEHYMLVFEEWKKALEEIYKREGPGLDGSSENASGRIARLALERFTQKRKQEPPEYKRGDDVSDDAMMG